MAQGQVESTGLVVIASEATRLAINMAAKFPDGVVTDTDALDAAELLAVTTRFLKKVDAARTLRTKPLLDLKKELDNDYGRIVSMIRQEDSRLRMMLGEYHKRQQEAVEALAARQAEIEEPAEAEAEEVLPVKAIVGDNARVDFKDNWTWEVLVEGMVPRKYLMLDRGAITRDVKAGVREIAGLRIFNQPVPAVTGGFRRPEMSEGGLANGRQEEGPEEAQDVTQGYNVEAIPRDGPGGIAIDNGPSRPA